jgi:iron complex outermembrane receptor protein
MPFGGIESFNLRGSYSDYTHDEIVAGEEIEEVEATFDNEEWEARAEVLHAGFGPIMTGAIGAQWSTRDFSAGGHGAEYLLPTETDSFALYAFERFGLGPQWSLELAGRADWTSVKGETDVLGSFDLDFTPLSFAGGLVFRPQDPVSIGINLSHTQRAPHVTELFAQGPHEASATFEIGDPTMGKERATSIEGVAHYDGMDGAHVTMGAFYSQFEGFIAGVLTGNSFDEEGNFFPDDSGEFAELLYVQEDAVFWGFEAQAHVPLFAFAGGMAGINAQADYVRAEFDSSGNVPRIPPFRFGGGLFYERDRLELRIDALHTSEQDDIAAGETPTDGFTMLDASATFRLLDLESSALDVAVSASNLLDETARNHVSFTKDHVLLPGRNFRLTLHWVF